MNIDIRGVHFDIDDRSRAYVEKKLERLDFAKDLVMELPISITKAKKGGFEVETNVHFKWGKSTHVGVQNYDLFQAIDSFFDKLEMKIGREKDKIQNHKGEASLRTGDMSAEEPG